MVRTQTLTSLGSCIILVELASLGSVCRSPPTPNHTMAMLALGSITFTHSQPLSPPDVLYEKVLFSVAIQE